MHQCQVGWVFVRLQENLGLLGAMRGQNCSLESTFLNEVESWIQFAVDAIDLRRLVSTLLSSVKTIYIGMHLAGCLLLSVGVDVFHRLFIGNGDSHSFIYIR